MEISSTKKVVFGVVATVILGAVGSGIWELVFSPSVTWIGRGLLTLVTLGLDSVSDAIYVDVAKGHHERSSLAVYSFVAAVVLFAPLFIAQGPLLRPKIRESIQGKKPEELEAMHKRLRRVFIYLLLTMTLLGAAIFVRSLMHAYTNNAVTYFNQSLTIVLPYVSPDEERRLRSEFARVSSKKEFEQLIKKLRDRAASNGIQLPQFSIW
jgi:hypothetical protein